MSRNHFLLSAALAAALGLATASEGRADAMHGSFDQAVGVMAAPSGTDLTSPSDGPVGINFGDATVTLAGAPAVDVASAGDGSDTVIGNIGVAQTKPGTSNIDLNYGFRLTLTDADSAQSKVVDVTGHLTGTVTMSDQGMLSSLLNNSYDFSKQVVTIGQNDYTITAAAFTPPQAGQALSGGFGIHIASFPTPHPVPEPTTLVLLAVGGASGLFFRRRMSAKA